MTDDYKNTLLKYFSGNLTKETKPNIPVIGNPIQSVSTLGSYLEENAGSHYEIKGLLQGYQSTYSIIYGNTQNNDGFIVIIDENYNPVQYINAYNTGTLFGEFQVLNVAEDGNVYGIDIKNNTPRFIMLNNITLKLPTQSDFSVRLRQSYNLPSPLSTASEYFAVVKAVGQGKYLIGGTIMQNNQPYQIATELTIIVGAQNEWVDYQDTTSPFIGQCMWASWNQDIVSFKIGGYVVGTNAFYVEYQKIGETIGKWSMELPSISGLENNHYSINTTILNENTTYVGVFNGGASQTQEEVYLYKVDYTEQDVDLCYSYIGAITTEVSSQDRIKFIIKNGIVFFMLKVYNIYSSVSEVLLHTGMILNETVTLSTAIGRGDSELYEFYVSNIYNLYNYNILGLDISSSSIDSYNFLIQQVYNVNNYNGEPYENTNSLIPNNGILYDSNNNILFARNLYNKSVYGNTTLSVLQIPNTMVNDITIDKQDLVGETKKVLVENQEDFIKNIYETVYLNFYNTLLIQNRNTQTYITNQYASELLNQSVSLAADYDDMKATKYKINYVDGTNEIFETQPTITNGVATYNIQLIIPWNNLATSLQIISEDETTTYQTISTSNLEPGKIYNITQECYVE